MFSKFNFNLFPIVIVEFSENIKDEKDFDYFLQGWISLYQTQKDFIFIFDTTKVGMPPIKYCFKMSAFISRLRKEKYHYLQKSIIIVKNKRVMRLLNLIFFLQPPVANVYLTQDNLDKVLKDIDNINILKTFKAKKPILPFL